MPEEFWTTLVTAVVSIALAAISTWGSIVLKKIAEKTKLQISEATEAAILQYIVEAVRWAEEQAHKAIKDGIDPMDGYEKLTRAESRARELLAAAGLPAPSNLTDRIEAVVNVERKISPPLPSPA